MSRRRRARSAPAPVAGLGSAKADVPHSPRRAPVKNAEPARRARGGRINAVDGLRGFAICMMVVYHFSFDLNFFGVIHSDFNHDRFWLAFRDVIITSFMTSGRRQPRVWRNAPAALPVGSFLAPHRRHRRLCAAGQRRELCHVSRHLHHLRHSALHRRRFDTGVPARSLPAHRDAAGHCPCGHRQHRAVAVVRRHRGSIGSD